MCRETRREDEPPCSRGVWSPGVWDDALQSRLPCPFANRRLTSGEGSARRVDAKDTVTGGVECGAICTVREAQGVLVASRQGGTVVALCWKKCCDSDNNHSAGVG